MKKEEDLPRLADKGNETADASTLRSALAGHMAERIPMNELRPAAVLIPLVRGTDEAASWQVLFEIRASTIVQGGEICFPGGSIETGETPAQAALRETTEELLLAPSQIELICPMHQVAGPGGREVTSYLGVLYGYQGTFARAEVAQTFLLPLSWFAAHPPEEYSAQLLTQVPENFPMAQIGKGREYPFQPIAKKFYFYSTPYGILWGMTAQLMHAALSVLEKV